MAEQGSIKARLDKVTDELEVEVQLWHDAKLPPVGHIWRLGENEFMTHVHVMALDRLLRRLLTNDEVELEIKTVFLEQLREARKLASEVRRESLRASVVDGINIIKPPEI